ncbi:MAG: Rieske 2Fe-2S domain-containing protein [Bdellovibrio sp.]|nr:Rieske 2Fe-2S domain-containing protein [Bdellovibrio sp.]
MPEEKEIRLGHRDFLGWILKGGIAVTLVGFIFPAITYLLPLTHQAPVGSMIDVGMEGDIPIGTAKKIISGGKVILVVHMASGFKAFSAICTHLGCIVDWDDKKHRIACPCHAGFFNPEDGTVISGPPPKPLLSYSIKVVNGRVMVTV